ncbi:sulfatase-like hydrolase/transferase [candidate division KSB1 bacterium]|nr:sulfatase-like hydrolase/transferase [candidate division KSB1 bacterium]
MNRRTFIKTAAASALALNGFACRARVPARSQKPNIVLIMADDLGYECIGANGGESYQTPVLDKLAANGVRFEHAYAQPLCTPTRVQLLTGIYNVRNYTDFGVLDKNETTFANLFKNAGYATCIVGKWQLGGGVQGPNHFGFDDYCLWQLTPGRTDSEGRDTRYPNPKLNVNGSVMDYKNGEYGPDVVSDYACDFIQKNQDTPFLLYYPMILTHCPFAPTPDSEDWNPEDKGSLSYKGDPRYFEDMVRYMDKMVGKLIATLESCGLRENTLIIFTGDNGTDEPIVSILNGRRVAGAKGEMTNAGTRVPLIAGWPGVIPTGTVCRDLVDFSDFFPTLCDAADIPIPENLNIDGRSFLPQVMGKKGKPREWSYCWYSRNGKSANARVFARTRRYKLYQTGEFYDIQEDVPEQKPLKQENLNDHQLKTRAMLNKVIKRYQGMRKQSLN